MTSTRSPGDVEFVRLDYRPPGGPGDQGAELSLALYGDIDLADVTLLRSTLENVTALPACPVRVDLADVTFLGSTGLNFLCALHNHAAAAGHRVTVANPPAFVLRALLICGLDELFGITGAAPGSPRPGA
jgi:anti-anti-sigma factor